MAMMHEKSHAREGRGGGNGGNENWYNSQLWDNIGPRKTIGVTKEQVPEEQLTEEQKIRRKRQELLRSIY